MEARVVDKRAQKKSSEGEFLYELQRSYELSPKLSQEIVRSAKEHLLCTTGMGGPGQQEITVVALEERAGKIIERMEKKKVRVTIDDGTEDREVLRAYGREALRQVQIERMTEEAIEQGGVLSQEDLSRHLMTSVRTIKRDIHLLKQRGIVVTTRGVLQNIGRGQTHKVKIVGMYLDGMTYSELMRKTHHSVGAIKRYLAQFTEVVMADSHGLNSAEEISQVTGLSVYIIGQYLELLGEVHKEPTRRRNLREFIERSSYRPELKKTPQMHGKQAVRMIGGGRDEFDAYPGPVRNNQAKDLPQCAQATAGDGI